MHINANLLHNALNFRSLCSDTLDKRGKSTLFRSGDLSKLTANEAFYMYHKLGIRSYLDLRSDREVEVSGLPQTLLNAGIQWYRFPLTGYSGEAITQIRPRARDYAHYYLEILKKCCGSLIEILVFIENHLPIPLVFGCFAGKDRTGLLAATILEITGISRIQIEADYARSARELRTQADRFQGKWTKKGERREDYLVRLNASPETMQLLFEELDHCYGGLISFLHEGGLPLQFPLAFRIKIENIMISSEKQGESQK